VVEEPGEGRFFQKGEIQNSEGAYAPPLLLADTPTKYEIRRLLSRAAAWITSLGSCRNLPSQPLIYAAWFSITTASIPACSQRYAPPISATSSSFAYYEAQIGEGNNAAQDVAAGIAVRPMPHGHHVDQVICLSCVFFVKHRGLTYLRIPQTAQYLLGCSDMSYDFSHVGAEGLEDSHCLFLLCGRGLRNLHPI
jgi:hypothetical protein